MTTQASFAGCPSTVRCHGPARTGKAPTEATVTVTLAGDETDLEVRALTYLDRDERDGLQAWIDGHAEALIDGVWTCVASIDIEEDDDDAIHEAIKAAALEDAGCPS